MDGDAVKAAVEAGASDIELQDMMEDMSMTRYRKPLASVRLPNVTEPKEQEEFMEAFKAAGLTCILQNAGEEGNSPLRLIKRLARFTYVTDMMRDFVQKAVTPDDIVNAKEP